MPTEFNGLPTHVLLVHVVVVFVPVAAAMLVAHAVWPAARRRLGVATPAVAFVAMVFVPVTTNAGEWLRDHLSVSTIDRARIREHADLGDSLLPLVIGMFVVSAVLWYLGRRAEYGLVPDRSTRPALPKWISGVIAAVAIAVAVVNTVQVYRAGDSGAQAAWTGRTTSGG